MRCRRSCSPRALTETFQAVSAATRERGGARKMPDGMRGARDPRGRAVLSPGMPPTCRAHLAGGDTPRGCCFRRRTGGSGGQWRGQASCHCPPLPQPLPRQCPPARRGLPESRAGGAHPPCPVCMPGMGRECVTVPNSHSSQAPQHLPTTLGGPWGPAGAPARGTALHTSGLVARGTPKPGLLTCSSSLAVELGMSWQGAVSSATSLQHRVARGRRGQLVLRTIAIWSLLLAL